MGLIQFSAGFSSYCPAWYLIQFIHIPWNMLMVLLSFALFCLHIVLSRSHVIYWPYSPGLLHGHWGNRTIAPVPVKQPWRIWLNPACTKLWQNMNYVYNSWDVLLMLNHWRTSGMIHFIDVFFSISRFLWVPSFTSFFNTCCLDWPVLYTPNILLSNTRYSRILYVADKFRIAK